MPKNIKNMVKTKYYILRCQGQPQNVKIKHPITRAEMSKNEKFQKGKYLKNFKII